MTLFCGSATAAPAPINTQFDDQDILVTLPEPALTTTTPPADPNRLADLIQAQIQQARSTGDPRFTGYAEGLLQQWNGQMTDRLRVLKATIDQSNHRFEQARNGLTDLIGSNTDPQQAIQARLMLANIELVQGRYDAAAEHCNELTQRLPGLIAASCQAQAQARTGQPVAAYQQLKQQFANAGNATETARIWALGTLGDLAAQLDNPAAKTYWLALLSADPDDLYTRAQLADWYLARGEVNQVLSVTEGYETVDSLAVIRAIALEQAGHPDAGALKATLTQRFAEAQWRGNLLHKRDFARFQLDLADKPESALENAQENWADQREPSDTRLLLRAAISTGNTDQIASVKTWLSQNGQQDARYPEINP
ncbi:hypothetical protein E5Q11_11895 [Marinobacter confluentis]|uniref:Tetratricopeptide repeat protein n=1 Tax=Marinobacter confluentis TaxID=1697557 RepID=A0A4Z1CGW9_9GAMM|nr:hypothetical protein E5Q11_11895 [Marinobacter confluentis]